MPEPHLEALFQEGLVDLVLDLLDLEGLGDVILGAAPDGIHGRIDGGVARDHDECRVGVRVPDFLQELQTVHLRHHEVRQDDVEALVAAQLQCRARIVRRFHVEIEGTHVAAEDLEHVRVVVEDKGLLFSFSVPDHDTGYLCKKRTQRDRP